MVETDSLLNILNQVEATGTISRQDYFRLMTLMLANQINSPNEAIQINELLNQVRLNQLQLVD